MNRLFALCLLLISACVLGGCMLPVVRVDSDSDLAHYLSVATRIAYADVAEPLDEVRVNTIDPQHVQDGAEATFRDMSLQEAVALALRQSKVLRDLGATVLRSPDAVPTVYGPAIQESEPALGVEAAVSEFDANLQSSVVAERVNRRFNNRVFGLDGLLEQDLFTAEAGITKRSVTGGQFALRHRVIYDANNAPTNSFPYAYDTIVEAEVRQPLLQGAGVEFNRLAGPSRQPGVVNGVLVARTRTDISLSDFEIGVRDFLADVENAYWDLYYAYRELDALRTVRDRSLETWRSVEAWHAANRQRGESSNEAQAREQYFRFQQEVEDALKGRPAEGTRTHNGNGGGAFRGTPGVRTAERRLRLLIGLPISDGQLLRPADEPPGARFICAWEEAAAQAAACRPELRRQRWQVKQREFELLANRNFLLPNLDLVGQYRFRGFGENLLDSADHAPFPGAYPNLFDGGPQEWQAGLQFSAPIGYRRAQAAVRNAQLKLARARAVLEEQERQVLHDVSNAVAEVDRAYQSYELGHARLLASSQELEALETLRDWDQTELYVVLDAQRRFADAASRFHQAHVEYALAIRNLHFEKGSLLDYYEVSLAEGPWPAQAYCDARKRAHRAGFDAVCPDAAPPSPQPSPGPTPAPAAPDPER